MAVNKNNNQDPYELNPDEHDPNINTLFNDKPNPVALSETDVDAPFGDIEEAENGTPRDEDDEGDFGRFSSEDSLRKVKQIEKKDELKDSIESLIEDDRDQLKSLLETLQRDEQDQGVERSLFDDPEDRAPFV